jgi:hypothetical protein
MFPEVTGKISHDVGSQCATDQNAKFILIQHFKLKLI